VRHALFNEPPSARGAPLKPQERNPLVVALLCFVPVLGVIYMLAHGPKMVTGLRPSRT
jgi:hypothetical protein